MSCEIRSKYSSTPVMERPVFDRDKNGRDEAWQAIFAGAIFFVESRVSRSDPITNSPLSSDRNRHDSLIGHARERRKFERASTYLLTSSRWNSIVPRVFDECPLDRCRAGLIKQLKSPPRTLTNSHRTPCRKRWIRIGMAKIGVRRAGVISPILLRGAFTAHLRSNSTGRRRRDR